MLSSKVLHARENKLFTAKKQKILAALGVDEDVYTDASPKGNLDAPIRGLIAEINAIEGLVTTSSCSGRVSVFVDGAGAGAVAIRGDGDIAAVKGEGREDVRGGGGGSGGKGGGRWLFVSHEGDTDSLGRGRDEIAKALKLKDDVGDVVDLRQGQKNRLDVDQTWSRGEQRLVHFKFEPMILHILTASLEIAQLVLGAAQQAGFRESGASSLNSEAPMVAVRTNGIALESIIGLEVAGQLVALVDDAYMAKLWDVAEARFLANAERIKRFEDLMCKMFMEKNIPTGRDWEDTETRKSRKRAEGLQRQALMQHQEDKRQTTTAVEDAHVIFEDHNA